MKAVLFDLGGTLVKTATIPEILKSILDSYGIQRPLTEIASAHREVEKQMRLEDYALPYREFWFTWNLRILKKLRVRENPKRLGDVITEEWWDRAHLELYPDAKETLNELRRMGIKMGIVTNGLQKDIEEILARTSLTGFFDATVGVDAVGKPKPHKEIFNCALERLSVPPHEALYVGDNLEIDYKGAEEAGVKALLLDRDGEVDEKVRKIRSLKEVIRYL